MTRFSIQDIKDWFDGPTQAPILIAGPCSIESPDQVLGAARGLVANTPISLIRGGAWKPRTKPGSFEGVGEDALDWLVAAGRDVGLPVSTEVANAKHVEKVLKAKVDVLWIGARTTVNPFYVQEIAEALRGVDIPVFVKNPIHAEIGLWAGAIERFQNVGLERVAAVHRGFYSTNKSIYRNQPHWHHSFDLRAMMPEIKIVCDPSHIAGKRDLVAEVAQVAMDLSMDGLMVESHPEPEQAWSDAAQQLTPSALGEMIRTLRIHDSEVKFTESEALERLRGELDAVDKELVEVLKKRFELVKDIADTKKQEGMTIFQMDRWLKLVKKRMKDGNEEGMTPEFMHDLFATLHKYSVEYQSTLVKKDDDALGS